MSEKETAEGVKAARPEPSNTGLAKWDESMSGGGTDWLSVRFFVKWADYEQVASRLTGAKIDAQERGDEDTSAGLVDFAGHIVQVGPTRGGRGFAAGEWVFKYEGLAFSMRKGEEPDSDQLGNLAVTMSGLPLLAWGLDECLGKVHSLIRAMGGEVLADKVSRWDAAADLVGVSMSSIRHAFDAGWIVRRSKEAILYLSGKRTQTIYLGAKGAPISVRIYDKLEETKNDADKRALMVHKRWGGKTPKSAVRVEFQLNREALQANGVDSIADLKEKMASILKYLAEEWLRFTADKPKRWAEKMAPIAAWWKTVQSAFGYWAGQGGERPLPLPKQGKSRLEKQALGCLAAFMAGRGFVAETTSEAYLWALEWFREKRGEFRDRLEQAAARLGHGLEEIERRAKECGTDFGPDSPPFGVRG